MAYRTPEQMVADLEQKIAQVKLRAMRKAARANPVVKEATAAIKALDRALAAGAEEPMRSGLEEARTTITQVVATTGLMLPAPAGEAVAPRKRKVKTAG